MASAGLARQEILQVGLRCGARNHCRWGSLHPQQWQKKNAETKGDIIQKLFLRVVVPMALKQVLPQPSTWGNLAPKLGQYSLEISTPNPHARTPTDQPQPTHPEPKRANHNNNSNNHNNKNDNSGVAATIGCRLRALAPS